MTVEWRGREVEAELRSRLEKNMDAATLVLKGEVQRAINRGNADGSDPSLPGEPPKKVTARLFQSIATGRKDEREAVVGLVGTNVEYARRLELGFTGTDSAGRTVDQAPRPYLVPTLMRLRDRLGKLLTR